MHSSDFAALKRRLAWRWRWCNKAKVAAVKGKAEDLEGKEEEPSADLQNYGNNEKTKIKIYLCHQICQESKSADQSVCEFQVSPRIRKWFILSKWIST